MPPPLMFLLGWGAGWLIQRRWPLTWSPDLTWSMLSLALVAAGLAIGFSALWVFRVARTSPNPWTPTQAIAVRGPYRFTRNPMYLGFAALYAGISIYTRTGWALVLLPLVVLAVQQGSIVREEAYLERQFGPAYTDYRRRVRRWL